MKIFDSGLSSRAEDNIDNGNREYVKKKRQQHAQRAYNGRWPPKGNDSIPSLVKEKTLKIIFAAYPQHMQNHGVKVKFE